MSIYRTLPDRPFGDEQLEMRNPACADHFAAAVKFFRDSYESGEFDDLDTLIQAYKRAEAAYSTSVGVPRAFLPAGRRSGRRRLLHPLDLKMAGELVATHLPDWGWPYDVRVRDDDAFGVLPLKTALGQPEKWVCVRAHGRRAEILTEGRYDSRGEALDAAARYVADLLDQRVAGAGADGATRLPGRPQLVGAAHRVGPSWRTGSVSAQEFAATFRFRGVEFGNWLSQDERQVAVDASYDALMDLTSLCRLPPAFASLGGKLGVGFASRGRGGAGGAHFEPSAWVLHFTKRQGAGALAHEFGHAFDWYVGELLEPGLSLSALISLFDDETHGYCEPGLREALAAPGRQLYSAMCGGHRPAHWTVYRHEADALDRGRKRRYWSSRWELFARAFEAWAMDSLQSRGQANEYLVYGAGEDSASIWSLPHAPYPRGDERLAIVAAIDDLILAAATYWKERRQGRAGG